MRSPYVSGSLKTIARKLAKWNLNLVGVEEVRKNKSCVLSYRNHNESYELGAGFFVHKGIIITFKVVEFVGCGILYVISRICWFDSIFVNIHVPLRINMMIQRKIPVRSYNTYLINFLSVQRAFITLVKRVEFISYRIGCRVLSRCWYDIIVLNVNVSLRIKVMVQRTVCIRNYIRCLINSPHISWFSL
jgi:hypothetical protein